MSALTDKLVKELQKDGLQNGFLMVLQGLHSIVSTYEDRVKRLTEERDRYQSECSDMRSVSRIVAITNENSRLKEENEWLKNLAHRRYLAKKPDLEQDLEQPQPLTPTPKPTPTPTPTQTPKDNTESEEQPEETQVDIPADVPVVKKKKVKKVVTEDEEAEEDTQVVVKKKKVKKAVTETEVTEVEVPEEALPKKTKRRPE
jgi:hypothetical protein